SERKTRMQAHSLTQTQTHTQDWRKPHTHTRTHTHTHTHTMDRLRNHGPLGLDMLKAPSPPSRKKLLCARKTRTHTQTPLGVYIFYQQCVGFNGRIRYFGYCIGKVNRSKFTPPHPPSVHCPAIVSDITCDRATAE